jgi:hypothetical protein
MTYRLTVSSTQIFYTVILQATFNIKEQTDTAQNICYSCASTIKNNIKEKEIQNVHNEGDLAHVACVMVSCIQNGRPTLGPTWMEVVQI